MENELHTIRFKRGSVEFELTGSEGQVATAWTALEPAVVGAFEQGSSYDDVGDEQAIDNGSGNGDAPKKRRKRTTSAQRSATTNSERADVDKLLMETSLDSFDFAQLGNNPSSRIAGYAVLDWAHKKLDTDGLTSQEIQKFLSVRLRVKATYQAYAHALSLRVKVGEIDKVGNIYRLMGKGEEALAAHVKKVAETAKGG
jgi:hypothetical protein